MKNKTLHFFFILILLTSCTYVSQGLVVDFDRYAAITKQDIFGDNTDKIAYLDQNWDRYDSLWFYFTTQGSDFMPYEIFLYLEQAKSQSLFRDATNMNKYRFLIQKSSYDNPEALPVGFVEDTYQDESYIGFTCAACHTTQINYQGTGIRIDGAPALADFEGFFLGIENALKATLANSEKFDRLANIMIDKQYAKNKEAFRQTLKAIALEREQYNKTNAPVKGEQLVHYGYGRLDAFGRIYNRVLQHLTPDKPNANPANAPVSYPFLWDTPHHDFVQWNGVGNNNPGGTKGFLGPLGRNTGEVLGVFAKFELTQQPGDKGFRSSVVRRNLLRLEDHLITLQSPVWPENILPKIDQKLAKKGEKIYQEYQCDSCHSSPDQFDRTSSDRRVIAQFSSLDKIQTDPAMAINALISKGNSGFLQGTTMPDSDQPFAEITPALFALKKVTAGVIAEADHDIPAARRWAEQAYDFSVASFNNLIKETTRHVDFETDTQLPESLKAYKGRPLNGIWATAPYLHNGSVPNLYELFLPSCNEDEIKAGKECRSNKFTLGSREFDPVKVGLVSKKISKYPDLFEFDTTLAGNKNGGHEYAAGKTAFIKLSANGKPIKNTEGQAEVEWLPPINKSQRLALVEYLKQL